ncbi:MAG: hypothetical protein AAF224_14950 [Pseudomonadota bacterium]
MTTRAKYQRGASLPEVIVSVAILAMISVSVASALSASARARGRIETIASENEMMDRTEKLMSSIVSQTIQTSWAPDEFAPIAAPNRFGFMTYDAIRREPIAARFQLEGNQLTLVLRDDVGASPAIMLVSDIAAGSFSYFGSAREGQAPIWSRRWLQEQPPSLVRLEIELGDGSKRQLEFATIANGALDCVFDSVSRRCRS